MNMYRYTEEDKAIITAARKANKDKRAEKRLHAMELRVTGKSAEEIAAETGFHSAYPIEQIWKEIRKRGFKNEIFASLEKVIDRLCDTICSLSADVIRSITGRNWILNCFIRD